MNAVYWVEKLGLMPHPEGGFLKETYQSEYYLPSKALPTCFSSQRKISTAIYFLLNDSNFSTFHKIKSDEIWHFYQGSTIEIYYICELRVKMQSSKKQQLIFQKYGLVVL